MRALLLLVTASTLPAQSPYFRDVGRDHLPAFGERATAIAAVDADADGDADLVIAGATRSAVWLNDGFGTFGVAPAAWLPATTPPEPRDIAAGDLDGDGLEDLIWTNPQGAQMLLLSTGSGFVDATAGRLPAQPVGSTVELFDADGDGDLDLVAGGGSASSLWLYRNDGTGRFSPAFDLGGAPQLAQVLPVDVDNDADLDLVITPFSGQPTLHLNDGSGGFTGGPTLPPASSARTCAAGDIDGDGDQDLVVGTVGGPQQRQDRLFLNTGGGVFVDQTASRLPVTGGYAEQLALFDAENDGDLDLLLLDARPRPLDGRLLQLMRNDGSGTFTDATPDLGALHYWPSAFVLLDANTDGDLDVAAISAYHGDHLLWNRGGTFVDLGPSRLGPGVGMPEAATTLDFDGDGDLDIVTVCWQYSILNAYNRVLENVGGGRFVDRFPRGWPAENWAYEGVAAGDVDRDGDQDLVLALDGRPLQLWRNDGGGTFTDISNFLPTLAAPYRDVDLGDLDGDGDLDLVAAQAGPTLIAMNNGAGRFADVTTQWNPGVASGQGATLGDVDGDGDLDLAFASAGTNALWLNDRGQRFVDASQNLPASVRATEELVFADLDADGDLDMLAANASPPGVPPGSEVLWNDGAGGFLAQPTVLSVADVRAIAALDVDHDGDLDVVLGTWGAGMLWAENVGAGFAPTATLDQTTTLTSALLAGDFDGDGDTDLFEGTANADRMLINEHRQLDSTRSAVSGGSLRLAVTCRPGPGSPNLALIAVGDPLLVPWPSPFGPVYLAPATMAALGIVPLVAGEASITPAVPRTPSLVGLEFGFQALCFHGGNPTTWATTAMVAETIVN